MLQTISVALVIALGLVAPSLAAPAALSWDEIVGAQDGLFPSELNAIQSKSLDTAILVGELSDVLGQESVLNAVYNNYMVQYNKESSRLFSSASKDQFKSTLVKIAQHNLEAQTGKYSWTEGVNQFTDMSDEEYSSYLTYTISFSEYYAKLNISKSKKVQPVQSHSAKEFKNVSWREFLTPVKDQKKCGSCYAFSTVGQLEAHYSINNGVKLDLSEQQVVDCSQEVGNHGCNGGSLRKTATFLALTQIGLESDYPYTAEVGECQSPSPAGPQVYEHESFHSESEIQENLATGPVTVSVDASSQGFKHYKSGILTDCPQKTNHAVLAVGLGTEGDQKYYDIKNSWGTRWGDQGFLKIGANNRVCGIGKDGSQIVSN